MNHYAARFFLPAKKAMPLQAAGTRRKIAQVRMQLACAEDLFNCATDDAVVDSSIYQLKSLQVYYSFLMRQLRLEEGAEEQDEDPLSFPAAGIPESGDAVLPELREEVVEAMG